MKTYEETIRTVFSRAEAKEQQRKKRRTAYRAAARWVSMQAISSKKLPK